MMLRIIFLLLCLIVSDLQIDAAYAASLPPVLSLNDAVMLALRYNPQVRSARLQRVVDKFNLRVAQWAYEVQYSVNANYNYNDPVVAGRSDPSDLATVAPTATYLSPIGTQVSVSANNAFNQVNVGHATYYNPTVTFAVTQPLLKGFGRDITLEPLHAAQNQEMAAQLSYKAQIMGTITNVVSQYAAVVNAQNTLKADQVSLQTSVATLNQQQELIKAGRAAPADLIQFQAAVSTGKLAVEQAQVALLQAKQGLLVMLGIDPCIPINVADSVDYPNQDIPCLAKSIQLALQYNVDYQKQFITLKDDELQLLVARNAQRWELDATAQRIQGQGIAGIPSTGPNTLLNNFNVVNAYGVTLTVPIDNLAQKNQLVQAKIGLQQQQIALEAAKETIISTITSDYYTVISQKQQIDQAQQSVDLAKKNLAVEQAKYTYGRSSAFELASLQSAVTTAQISYINSMTSYIANLAAFDQALGIALSRWNLNLCY